MGRATTVGFDASATTDSGCAGGAFVILGGLPFKAVGNHLPLEDK